MSVAQVFPDVPCLPVVAWNAPQDAQVVSTTPRSEGRVARIGAMMREAAFRRLADFLSERLAEAASPEDLDVLIEDIVLDSEYALLQKQVESALTLDMVRQALISGMPTPPHLIALSAGEFSRLLDQGVSYDREVMQAIFRLMGTGKSSPGSHKLERNAILLSPHFPPSMKQSLLAIHVGCVAQYALRSCDPKAPRWYIRKLFEDWVAGGRESLRALAGIPGAMVPAAVVPDEQRLDMQALLFEHAQAEAGYEERLAAARASGADVYPPPAASLDD